MALITLPSRHLHLQAALPFRVYDARGMLLLASGATIEHPDRLAMLRDSQLYVDEQEAGHWLKQADQSVQTLMLRDAPLQQIAAARWQDSSHPGAADRNRSVVEQWENAMRTLWSAHRDVDTDPAWLERLQAALARSAEITRRYPNEVLFLLIQHAAHTTTHYSSHHAALCAMVCARVARTLGWPEEDCLLLKQAAITMNVSMTQLQDRLAMQKEPPSAEQRTRIDSHALRSATLLASAGVKDPRWLKVVRLHHDLSVLEQPLARLDPASRMARLLGVVDRFTAKISRRANRAPMSPLAAARDACVGPDGRPDELGSALLKTLGMYPPGSYVQLANGEAGVVLARGGKANEPLVAVLVGASGLPLADPVLRDTALRGRTVTGAMAVAQMRVRIHHEKLLELL